MTNETNAKPGASIRAPKMQESEQLAPTFWRDEVGTAERYVRGWVYLFCFVFCIASWTGLVFGILALLSI